MDSTETPPSRQERLKEFYRRLSARPPFESFEEAWAGLAAELHQVEDELSGIPRHADDNTEAPYDGRFYPPVRKREQPDVPGVRSFRQKRHLTSFAANGAIEIVPMRDGLPALDQLEFEKPGSDGRRVADFRSSAPKRKKHDEQN